MGKRGTSSARPNSVLTRKLIRWFAANRRDLPWRTALGAPRDPYHVLVSESMLQQTQVSRVIEKFHEFTARFPSLRELAAAPEKDVLAAWSGLGYYRRARNLHASAKQIVERFGGKIPRDLADLLSLPGIGPYTAGAIASIAFSQPTAAVDGNIQRVLMRLDGKDLAPTSNEAQTWVWARAGELVAATTDPGEWNEALMELGATVCTPKSPRCMFCPLAGDCKALAQGCQEEIPAPKPRASQREVFHDCIVVRDRRGRVLIEVRPSVGMWAGMVQAPTLERDDRHATIVELKRSLSLDTVSLREEFTHQTTHRTVRFRVYEAAIKGPPIRGEFATPEEVLAHGISNPQRRILLNKGTPSVSERAVGAPPKAKSTSTRKKDARPKPGVR